MKTAKSYLLDLWRDLTGLPPVADSEFELMKVTEWSPRFEQLMRNRLMMGFFRYGPLAVKRANAHKYDCPEYAVKKLRDYQATGNKEFLVDAANMCLLEFELGSGVWKPIDDGEHQPIKQGGNGEKTGKN